MTFEQQTEVWLTAIQSRNRRPVKPSTLAAYKSCLHRWLLPAFGTMDLFNITNLTIKNLVTKMFKNNLSSKSIHNYILIVKTIISSAIDQNGEKLYPKKWNQEFLDLPEIKAQNTPTFTSEEVSKILESATGQEKILYSLLAGTGLRIGEALALQDSNIINSNIIRINQNLWQGKLVAPKTKNSYRDIDLHPSIGNLLKSYNGFLFQSNGKPLWQSNIINRSFHPILRQIGLKKTGFHAFRRFRISWLRKKKIPDDLIRYWVGHSDKTITDRYSKLKEDVDFRREMCYRAGLGFEL